MRNYQKLDAWKTSMQLAKTVYTLVREFPKEELYGLSSQVKRAAISIPANIAEGMGRQYKKDTIQFLHIARGSIYELETLLKIAVYVTILSEEKPEIYYSNRRLYQAIKRSNKLSGKD